MSSAREEAERIMVRCFGINWRTHDVVAGEYVQACHTEVEAAITAARRQGEDSMRERAAEAGKKTARSMNEHSVGTAVERAIRALAGEEE